MPSSPRLQFPKHFLWGASTSAHQMEGGLHNQWSVWELENAKSLAAQASYHYNDLTNWSHVMNAAKSPANYVSGKATNHYQLYEQDIELVKKLNMNTFRFSVEWSRVQPQIDAWNSEAVDHYKDVLKACERRGVEPVMTLFHFSLPVWFAEMGGFEHRRNVRYFVQFCERILQEIGPSVRYVITINEPEVYANQSYSRGEWPPQVQSTTRFLRVLNNLARAHNQAADKIHALSRKYKVSIAKNSSYVYPGDNAWLSVRAAGLIQYLKDDYFLKKIVKRSDFIGVNYYFSERVYGYRIHNPDLRLSDVGWDLEPADLEYALERLHEKYHMPILITENGLADEGDTNREWWLMQTVLAMQKALDKGVNLLGYIHWSLMDNFEWDKGFWPRYGLFAVDYKTQQRTPRKSAVRLARLLKRIREESR